MGDIADQTDVAAFRAEVDRILASPEFSSSRHLQEFLRYTAERAISGVTHLEQVEIAASVLGRGDTFDPVQDASVRKLASLARQRLEQYYARAGTPPFGVVTLPLRSYLPRFGREPSPDARVPAPSRRRWWLAATLLFLAVATTLGWFAYRDSGVKAAPHTRWTLATTRGDIQYRGADVLPSAVLLGPELRPFDDLVARLVFSPTQEAQQAGIIAWRGPDDFIKLGRRFQGRNQLELTVERAGASAYQFIGFDPEGQAGAPIWLALRRQGNDWRAFLSQDGLRWEAWGEPASPAPLEPVRAGIFAFHGRRDAVPATATFEAVATGVDFALPGLADAAPLVAGGWQTSGSCRDGAESTFRTPVLQLSFQPVRPNCNYELARPTEGQDWEIETRLDYVPRPGASASLAVTGEKGSLRLARYFLNGPSVALIHDSHTLVGEPDFPGSPPLVLRLRCEAGLIAGSFSADGKEFHRLRQAIALAALGGKVRSGIRITTSSLDPDNPPAPARFYWFRQNVAGLRPHR